MNFTDAIVAAKPNISAGSIKTYNSLLRTIHTGAFPGKDADIKNFSDTEKVIAFIGSKTPNIRKTYLSALQAVAPQEIYKQMILSDAREHNKEVQKSELTDKLEESAITDEEMTKVLDNLDEIASCLFKRAKSMPLRSEDIQDIQNWVIMNLYSGRYIVPRRALDYCLLKFRNYDKENDNYFDVRKSKFVFNKYKTAVHLGTQSLDVPPRLKDRLKKWISMIPSDVDYLLFNTKNEPLTAVTLNQRLNYIFDGKKSINALRHYYLTKNYKHIVAGQDALADDMTNMGSDARQVKNYVKVNPGTTKTTYPSVEAAYTDMYKQVLAPKK
jgi:hypothetical protein